MIDASIPWPLSVPPGDRIPDPSFFPAGANDNQQHDHFIGRETEDPEGWGGRCKFYLHYYLGLVYFVLSVFNLRMFQLEKG